MYAIYVFTWSCVGCMHTCAIGEGQTITWGVGYRILPCLRWGSPCLSQSDPVSTSCLTVGVLGYHLWLYRGSWDLNSAPQAWTIRIDSLGHLRSTQSLLPLPQVHCSCALRPGGKGLSCSLAQLLSRLSALLPQDTVAFAEADRPDCI